MVKHNERSKRKREKVEKEVERREGGKLVSIELI
jgi:hypothetical protein